MVFLQQKIPPGNNQSHRKIRQRPGDKILFHLSRKISIPWHSRWVIFLRQQNDIFINAKQLDKCSPMSPPTSSSKPCFYEKCVQEIIKGSQHWNTETRTKALFGWLKRGGWRNKRPWDGQKIRNFFQTYIFLIFNIFFYPHWYIFRVLGLISPKCIFKQNWAIMRGRYFAAFYPANTKEVFCNLCICDEPFCS